MVDDGLYLRYRPSTRTHEHYDGSYKANLQATIDNNRLSIYCGYHTTSVICSGKYFIATMAEYIGVMLVYMQNCICTAIWNVYQRYLDVLQIHPPPNAAYMRQWIGPTLVHIMAFRLFGAKPLHQPMLAYCQLDFWEQISMKFESEFYNFHFKKVFEIVVCQNGGHFVQG